MTRKYKLARLQKNILLGVSGMALASTMMLGGAQTATTSTATSTSTTTPITIKNINKTRRAEYDLCKKNAKTERLKIKTEADKKYFEAVKILKDKRLSDLSATRTATTSTSTPKLVYKERQALRLSIERKYQDDLRVLKDIRHAERVKADENYDKAICKLPENNGWKEEREEKREDRKEEKRDDRRDDRREGNR